VTERRRTHLIDPDHFVQTQRDRPWCGAFGARYSPMVEHPHEADCQRCLDRWRVWERQQATA
jgi:hypothetical protein